LVPLNNTQTRTEFVKTYAKKLCSDACSRFVTFDPKKKDYIEEIKEATEHLYSKMIPSFATTLIPICMDHINSTGTALQIIPPMPLYLLFVSTLL